MIRPNRMTALGSKKAVYVTSTKTAPHLMMKGDLINIRRLT